MGSVFDTAKYILEKCGTMSTIKSCAIIHRLGLWYGMMRPCSTKILKHGPTGLCVLPFSITARENFRSLPMK